MTLRNAACLLWALCLFFATCAKKKIGPPPTRPSLTTSPVANITTSAAISGGTITDDGGAGITASGICWSSTIQIPSITDDTTKGNTASGSFTAALRNLQSGIMYYVRAYAISSEGIGYGNVVYFTSANAGPEARNIIVLGMLRVNETIRTRFTYFDAENDPAGDASYQWYVANDSTGAAITAIPNATDSTLGLTAAVQGKFLKVGITAKVRTGTVDGAEARSYWIGPIGAPELVTFVYNGQTVNYGVITSAVTGRKWLDRNLGAPAAATAHDDWQNMGDLFQWGRGADGHQLIARQPPGVLTRGVNGVTALLSDVDNPGHGLFITTTGNHVNWRTTDNIDLWQPATGVNNVCPAGWHVPTKTEWEAELLGKRDAAYAQLKITTAGFRAASSGNAGFHGTSGAYWSSTARDGAIMTTWSTVIEENVNSYSAFNYFAAWGLSVRCIKD